MYAHSKTIMSLSQYLVTISLLVIIQTSSLNATLINTVNTINVSELFSMKIEPRLFNWTHVAHYTVFTYRPSLQNYPDLPSWMRYMYSTEYRAGYLYGTPPKQLADTEVHIEIVGLNRDTYETRKLRIVLLIAQKMQATNLVQMKIDNLNWVHLTDPGRMENLKNLFRVDLWPESAQDLRIVFMESATRMGVRLPLKPQQTEGVIVHLGSDAPLSKRLQDLQNEVKPLYKISTCNYKKTSVQRIFQTAGFVLDWCAFRTIGDEGEMSHQSSETAPGSESSTFQRLDRWEAMAKDDAPQRNYIDELAFSLAIPAMIFAILITILTTVLCFQHEFIEPTKPPTVQMVQYSDATNPPTTTLKSLKDTPSYLIDNLSVHSQSPLGTLAYAETSSKTGNSTLRPKPPPYKPSPSSSTMVPRNGSHDI